MDADYPAVVEEQPVWVAVDDRGDRVVGVLVLEIEPDHLQVDNVAVDPGLQGAGIGSRLLEIAEDAARAAQVSEVRLFTHVLMASNIALYKRRGYVEVERRDEDAFSRVFFTKRLGPTGQGRGPAGGSPTGHR
jgi:ribosomal protein S18 acetylase RimI-like enzyme